jgi:NADH:ubiquinone oxidoreductase subunit 6 (subunit J)
MEPPPDLGPSSGTKITVALLAGLVVILLMFPASGVDSDPPVCRAMLGYVVPCEAWVAWAAAAATAGIVAFWLWRRTPISADPGELD